MMDLLRNSLNPYFEAYEDLEVHKIMLRDEARTSAYSNAILMNTELFKDKVVMDVGAGTGVLSLFCAKAGAKRVYAIEAAPRLIHIIQDMVVDNELSNIITIVHGTVETLQEHIYLPPDSIDIIVSEWMGFFLLHEGMLESVISARKYLKKDGLMFPDKCSLQAALCELPDYFDWSDFYGLNFSSFGQGLRNQKQNTPQISYVKGNHILSKPVELFTFKTKEVSADSLQKIHGEFVVPALRDGKYQGLCIWFNVFFPGLHEESVYELSTSPFHAKTHWKQCLIVLPEEICVDEGEPVGFEITFQKNGPRTYKIEFIHVDESSLTHPEPCDCYLLRCRIVKQFMIDCSYKDKVENPGEPDISMEESSQ